MDTSKSQLIIHTLSLWFTSEEEARASLLYSYKHSLNGFAALLSEDEATKLSGNTCTRTVTLGKIHTRDNVYNFSVIYPQLLPVYVFVHLDHACGVSCRED